jgi:hypothetical protein
MPSYNQNFLDKRYISNTDIDINAMMSSVTGETIDGTFLTLRKELEDTNVYPNTMLDAGVNNHAIFAQNMVKETTTGKFFKSGQMFLHDIKCESNLGYLDNNFLATAFKTTQGLVELPIHTILKIGGIYDFYYYNDYEKDTKIDLDIVNGLKTNNMWDYPDNNISNVEVAYYIYDENCEIKGIEYEIMSFQVDDDCSNAKVEELIIDELDIDSGDIVDWKRL